MTTTTRLGIWMDHSSAMLMSLKGDSISTHTIESTFSHEVEQETKARSEHIMHNKEQQHQEAYYRKIAEEIAKYGHVLLFGPTKAKVELLNMLRADSAYGAIYIDVKDADKMTDNQKHAFVREHFSAS